MRIPKITIEFDRLICETEKAYQFSINNKDCWIPKSLCSDLKIKGSRLLNGQGGKGTINLAPFKYQEMTSVIPQSMDELVINDIQENLQLNTIDDYDIIEPKGIYLKEKQVEKIAKIKRLKKFFVYGQMRTGKTVIATTIAESRFESGIINRLIIISPLRTEKVWQTHLTIPFKFVATEHFSNEHTRHLIELDCDENTMVVLDESHQIKNKSAIRSHLIIQKTENAGHKCILTGTPIGKHAGDLYFQFSFLDKAILNFHSYKEFEDTHLLYGGREGKTVVAYTNIEEISKKISPYTVIMTRSNMNIDREKIYSVRSYPISNLEKYVSLEEKYQKMYDRGIGNGILAYMVKLQQCANGYEIDDDDKCVGFQDNGRTNFLKKILSEIEGESIVIYFKYNEDLSLLKKLGIPLLSGKTKKNEFNEIIESFNRREIKIIGLQQQMSLGFSLKACDYMIYFSRKFGSINSAQSEDRACESTEKPLNIIDISGMNTIDEIIKKTINKQLNIINLFKKEIKNEN